MRLPGPLYLLKQKVKRDPDGSAADVIAALQSLSDTIVWQRTWIEQLEKRLTDAGLSIAPTCFNCGSGNVEVEERQRQRRHTCQQCFYTWRIGMRDI